MIQENNDNQYGINRQNSNISVNSRNKSRKIIDASSMRKTENLTSTIKAEEINMKINSNKNQKENIDFEKQEKEFDDIFEKHFNKPKINLVEDNNDKKSFIKASNVEDNINVQDLINNNDEQMSSYSKYSANRSVNVKRHSEVNNYNSKDQIDHLMQNDPMNN